MKRDLLQQVRAARAALAATVGLGILIAVVTIAQMTLLSRIVAGVFLAHETRERVSPLLLLLLGAILGRAVLVWSREVAAQQGAIRVKADLRARLLLHLLRLGPAYTRGERTGELVTTTVEGIERLDAYVSRYLPQMALSVCVPLLIAVAIWPLDWPSAVLLLVTAPIIPLLMVLIGSYTEEHIQRQWTVLSHMSAHFLDAVQGLPTLILFNRGAAERERIAAVSEEFRDRTLGVLRHAFLSGLVLEFMATMAIALVAVTLGVRLLDGGISFERAFLILLLAPEFYRPLRDLGVHRHAGMEGSAAAARIMEILRVPLPADSDMRDTRRPGGLLTVELSDLTYTYPSRDRPALCGVSLTLRPGTTTALVGHSGAGKSTLVNLLLRFLDSQEGAIAVNGIPLAALPVEAWRDYVALVPQRPYLFYGTVRENIRLARPDAGDDEVIQAAERAGAAEFIAAFPQVYDTPIGERGLRLSVGQAQRLAIARAFLKDAPLLVLDEPTSSLDPAGETRVREALERLMDGRTVLVIAHRLNTVYSADQIAVLEHGRLVEVGPHGALLRHGGPYAHLMGVTAATLEAVTAPV